MPFQKQFIPRNIALLAAVLLVTLVPAAATTRASTTTAVVQPIAALAPDVPVPDAPAPLLLNYQGRLADPLTGAAKPDGTYPMLFALYGAESGGTALWSETRDVLVRSGLFSMRLGEVTPLPAIFDGRALWLAVTVGGDPQATPRLPVSFVAYTLYTNRAGTAGVADLAANANLLGGQPPANYAPTNHTHDAAAISAGTLAYDRFSAYGDLANDGRIGAASGMVAAGLHTHTGADIVDLSINTVDLAQGSVTSVKIADGSVAGADLAANSVDAAKIVDGSVGNAEIQDRIMKIGFPANALNHNTGGLISQSFSAGLRWQSNYTDSAGLTLPRPTDWDGTSDVTLRLWFFPTTATAGYVDWFIRPRAWSAGSVVGDAASLNSTAAVSVNQANVLKEQFFTIPAARLNTGLMWYITLQRLGASETYRDDVVLMTVELSYTAVR